ncbi:MAG: zinc dependent phospholipase C family protein [Deltaproteobacteria bacterium]|nr:zinc dependent phospholipase C family protein [Deltaproteobacteria bacterium]MBW2122976.1 zinc dependent phospholipase C family protein [Deltaproteobacteria bacterium]
MIYSLVLLFCGVFLLLPEPAWAWGPATHLQLGSHLLRDLSALSPFLQDLLRSFPHDYLYGCISADIIIGKRYTRYEKHCHNWSAGLQVLSSARTDAQKSFAYGYLSHLAADTVAHNYFIPLQMIIHYQAGAMQHPYWELRFDHLMGPRAWEMTLTMAKRLGMKHNPILDGVLHDTLFPFLVSKGIFNGLLLVLQTKHWQRMVGRLSSRVSWVLPPGEARRLMGLSIHLTTLVLEKTQNGSLLRSDPTGRMSLKRARALGRRLASLHRRGRLEKHRLDRLVSRLRADLGEGIAGSEPSHVTTSSASDRCGSH